MATNNTGLISVDGFEKCTNKEIVLIANTPTPVLSANSKREYSSFVVNSQGAEITLILGEPTNGKLGEGIPLVGKGSSHEITKANPYKGKVSAICGIAAKLSIVECEKN